MSSNDSSRRRPRAVARSKLVSSGQVDDRLDGGIRLDRDLAQWPAPGDPLESRDHVTIPVEARVQNPGNDQGRRS